MRNFTMAQRGLDRDSYPMKLFEKAKVFGVWNPSEFDLAQDIQDWHTLTADEQRLIIHLTALFGAGEEAVTLDLLPLIHVIASEGRIEEEMFLTTFLWEEAKHTDFFDRFLREVAQFDGDRAAFHGAGYRKLIHEMLPSALGALNTDHSPTAQIRASVTYNMIVEGTLAETGYHAFYTILKGRNILPATVQAIQKLQQDESRHIAYGLYLLSRLLAANPKEWRTLEATMVQGLLHVNAIINDIFSQYKPMPFNLNITTFLMYALSQYQKRHHRLSQARKGKIQLDGE